MTRRPKLSKLRELEKSRENKIPFYYCRNCGVALVGKPTSENRELCYGCLKSVNRGLLIDGGGRDIKPR